MKREIKRKGGGRLREQEKGRRQAERAREREEAG
jgi:hypothetical protein